ncbi:PASTA domain-containing penicillin-binding protein [Marininema halotolerans]|uniref:Stage V sporulation protein D (Sporulation-specific penicillin-binding protein)/penicillin-binding protein 2B n=1 Tax=Marininema halotolerans TaxID=1155944 RepID=A0A1I6QBS1_9BACL|nr:PASTA domain-containing penicillin-binding protein [Marininema halotolerans]SFS49917.1 stage V sporulation protein D (sporulation-specific penicillin-binding protein)/penicillin-binding protein 2B [Marininema halotolerans]
MIPTRKQSKLRSLFVGITCILLLTTVIFRLFWLQTVDASFLRDRAQHIWEKKEIIQPKRGAIVDRNGNELVQEVTEYYIAADLKQVKNKRETAERLSPLLDIPVNELLAKLNRKASQVELRKKGNYKISQKKRNQVMDLGLSGIYAIQTTGRKYIEGDLAAHVLGFVNVEGKPVGGLEQKYNQTLTGIPGKMTFAKDARGNRLPNQTDDFRPAEQGKNLYLTLDREIQHQVENQLDQVMARYQAKGATAIVADPKTGAILAMANRPDFDPNHFAETWEPDVNGTNIAVSSQFEPGSTFKIVTLGAAVQEKLFDANQTFQSGSIEVAGRKIRDWNDVGWGEISFAKGINLSSNVAFVKLGQELGEERMTRYIDRFGFGPITDRTGRPTGIDLPSEAKGLFYGYEPLHKLELATTAFGQGIAVTPIQQVMAVSAVANGGTLYRPYVVDHTQNAVTGKVEKKTKPLAVRKHVISSSSAAKVRQLLRDVVLHGTGKEADSPGYDIAGKTGTAQKINENGSGYDPDDYIVSFMGFAPAKNPRVVVYVAVDEPQGDKHGGTVAAPAAREMIKYTINQLNGKAKKASSVNAFKKKDVTAGNWKGKSVVELKKSLAKQEIRTHILGSGDKVLAQYPSPGEHFIQGRGDAYLITEGNKALSMPDLRGKSLREAMDVCRLIGLKPKAEGEGFVTSQSISPGSPLFEEHRIQLKLEPPKWQ